MLAITIEITKFFHKSLAELPHTFAEEKFKLALLGFKGLNIGGKLAFFLSALSTTKSTWVWINRTTWCSWSKLCTLWRLGW